MIHAINEVLLGIELPRKFFSNKAISATGQQNHSWSVYINNNSYELDVYVNMNNDEETVCEFALEVKRLLNWSFNQSNEHNNITYIVHSPF